MNKMKGYIFLLWLIIGVCMTAGAVFETKHPEMEVKVLGMMTGMAFTVAGSAVLGFNFARGLPLLNESYDFEDNEIIKVLGEMRLPNEDLYLLIKAVPRGFPLYLYVDHTKMDVNDIRHLPLPERYSFKVRLSSTGRYGLHYPCPPLR